MMKKTISLLILFCTLISLSEIASAQDDSLLSLEVIDPFIEVRTGPGRGYPIFYVMEEGEKIDVLQRRDGWYEVRGANGKIGWATPAQLSRTLQETGEPADLPTVSFGDYVKNKWRIGFSAGRFFAGDNADMFSAALSYRFNSWFSLEGETGRFYDSNARGSFYGANILVEPFSQWRVSPEFVLGSGKLSTGTQFEVISADEKDASYINFGGGANIYLGRNFMMRLDYRHTPVSIDNDTVTLKSWKIGFNTFF